MEILNDPAWFIVFMVIDAMAAILLVGYRYDKQYQRYWGKTQFMGTPVYERQSRFNRRD